MIEATCISSLAGLFFFKTGEEFEEEDVGRESEEEEMIEHFLV